MLKKINNKLKKVIHSWLFTYDYHFMIEENGRLPIRAYKNDAGYDLFISESIKIKSKQMSNIATGVSCLGHRPAWILLTGRSSTLINHGLIVNEGVIDADYTGELFVKIYNPTEHDVFLNKGMRVAQIIVIPHTSIKMEKVKNLNNKKKSIRGSKGFGSSGK